MSLYSKAVRGDVRAIMSILTMIMKLEPATASKPGSDAISMMFTAAQVAPINLA